MFICVITFAVLLQMAFSGMRISVSLDALSCGAGAVQVGVLISLISVCPMFLAMYAGRVIDRTGPRVPVVVSVMMLAVAASIPSLLPTRDFGLSPLYFTCVFCGLGGTLAQMLGLQLVGHFSTKDTRLGNYSWLAVGYSVAGLIAPSLSGTVIDLFEHRWAFVMALGFSCAGAIVIAACFSRLPKAWLELKKRSGTKHGAFELMRIPGIRNVLLVSGIVAMAWDLQHFMFPVYGNAIGLSASEIGWLMSIFFSATFVVRLGMGRMAKHLTEWQFLTLTLVVGTVSYAVFPLFDSFPALACVAFVLGLGLGANQPNVMSLINIYSPRGRVGEAIGIRTMIVNASHVFLPTIFGFVTAAIGVGCIFLAMAALMGGSAVLSRAGEKNSRTELYVGDDTKKT